jgi:hypothetical protein
MFKAIRIDCDLYKVYGLQGSQFYVYGSLNDYLRPSMIFANMK